MRRFVIAHDIAEAESSSGAGSSSREGSCWSIKVPSTLPITGGDFEKQRTYSKCTRYTVLGRGAKRRTSSVLSRRYNIPQISQRQKTSVRAKLAKRCRTRADLVEHCFFKLSIKNVNLMVEKGSLNRSAPLVNYITTRLDPWGHARTQLGFIVALLILEFFIFLDR